MADETWSLTSGHRFHYDIFLSFRGEDTRHNFTNKLYHELVRNGVRTFIDDEGLDRGEEIAPSLVTAIEDSAAAIAVISENYCSSKWCLEELAKITECKRLLLPVFYGVEPSDVKKQTGPFEEHFRNYDTLVEAEKVSRWREAMKKAGNTSGWHSRLHHICARKEAELIQSLVKKVLGKLDNTPIGVAKYPVGLHSRLDELLRLLNVKANGVIVLGLYGMGGVGKTTLAKALYNQFVVHFKKRSFISDVKEIARRQNGLATLQSKLIGDLTSGASPDIDDTAKGIQLMKECMNNEPVAIFLDDVDNADQLRVLVGGRDWFRRGSRVIITTRDKNVLLPSIVNENFEVKELSSSESLTLFSYHAFGREQPPKNFSALAEEVVTLSGGLPLALEVVGSLFFYKRRRKEREDVVQKLRQIRPGDLQNVLEISFGALDEQEKCIFLDLACLLLNTRLEREDAIAIFEGCGFGAESAIIELTAKSLLKIVDGNVLWMHDQLKDMGRQIVQRENFGDVGKRSRLWNRDDITDVLKNHKGTRNNEGIVLDFEKRQDQNSKEVSRIYLKKVLKRYIGQGRKENGVTFCTRAFQCMVNLRLLQINHVKLVGNFKLLPAELKWLQWKGCPLQVIPPELLSRKIAVLDLSESMITHVWKKKKWNCYQNKLKVMNLHSCRQLKEIPDLSGLQLKKLILEQCKELVKIHPSIGDLTTLTHLNMKDCQSILAFPDDVSGLKHLEVLILSGCSSLKELPEDLSGWKSLRELLLDGTAITKLPNSIFRLKELQMLNLNDCRCLEFLPRAIGNLSSLRELSLSGSALKELPDSIGNLKNLEELNLRMCKGLISLPDSLGNLESLIGLYLNNSSIKELPPSMGLLSHLKFLTVSNCKYLSELPNSISSLSSLVWLCLECTSVSELSFQLGNLKSLEKLKMGYCASIRSLPSSTGNMSCLTTLDLHNTSITELPDSIGLLETLWELNLNNCLNLQQLPASIGSLKSLCCVYMAETGVSELPDEIGMLSNLKLLMMRKKPQPREEKLLDMEDLHVGESSKRVTLPESFSNLSSLEVLDAHAWKFSGKISDDFQKLSALEKLDLGHNDFCSLPSSMKGLCVLKHLFISNCRKLKFLPELPSSLEWLNAANCSALERIASISNLEYLEQLQFSNCKKITDIPGLESLKSLVRLYAVGCNACLPSIKRRFSKDSLRHIKYLCVPGSDIPDWFIQEVPNVSTRKHRDIKGVIIGVVLSLDQQVEDSFRHKVPAIMDIQATITRPGDAKPKLKKTLNLEGVPDTDEDQLYLCRFQERSDVTFALEEGDWVQVAIRESPHFNGLKLKKHGMHLVFENEDDLDDNDEDLFDESQQSVSKKLANFFNSL